MAWLYTQVSVLVGTLSMMLFAIVLVIFRDQLGLLFTSDPEVIMLTSQAVPMLAVSLVGTCGSHGSKYTCPLNQRQR